MRVVAFVALVLLACGAPAEPAAIPAQGAVPPNLRGVGDGAQADAHGAEAVAGLEPALDADGWTVLDAAPDARTVYVSSSSGDDALDGSSPKRALRTLAAGKARLRNGHPDRLLLRRGDVWDEPLGQWTVGGRSAREPVVVGSYGDADERPLLRTGAEGGLHTGDYAGSPKRLAHVAFVGLHLVANGYTGSEGTPSGVAWRLPTDGLLFEDCRFEGYCNDVVIEAVGGRSRDVRIRRCVVVDAYTTGDAHAQGLYLFGIDDLLLEECVIHHNGWRDVPGAGATVFRHNVYVQNGNTGVRVRGNLIAEAGSHGLQLRPGGEAVDNLFVANPIALMLGSKTADDVAPVVARGNVILDGRDIGPSEPRGWGIEVASVPSGVVEGNLLAHRTHGGFPLAFNLFTGDNPKGLHDLELRDNTVYRWGGPLHVGGAPPRVSGIVFESNVVVEPDVEDLVRLASPALAEELSGGENLVDAKGGRGEKVAPEAWVRSTDGTPIELPTTTLHPRRVRFSAPERDLAAYAAELGLEGGREGFLEAARGQSRSNWRPELTAAAANAWIRTGFERY